MVLIVDSDVQFIRPFASDTFRRDGVVRFYRKPDEVDDRLPRHVTWHRASRSLLGLPAGGSPPYPDYVAALIACDPLIVRKLLERVESVAGQRWTDVIGRQLHFSEWTLYGVFVDEVLGAPRAFGAEHSLCHAYWDEVPLTERTLQEFLAATGPDDVAVMISAKSRTPMAVSSFASRWG